MKSKIAKAFEKCREEKRPALITYTVAGDNTKNNSLKILGPPVDPTHICVVSQFDTQYLIHSLTASTSV